MEPEDGLRSKSGGKHPEEQENDDESTANQICDMRSPLPSKESRKEGYWDLAPIFFFFVDRATTFVRSKLAALYKATVGQSLRGRRSEFQ